MGLSAQVVAGGEALFELPIERGGGLCPFQLLDLKIFVDTDSDIRLVRRLRRDISERGRDIEGVIKQYNKFVKPAFDQYIQPTMRLADIVVPRGTAPSALRPETPHPSARSSAGAKGKGRSLQPSGSKH